MARPRSIRSLAQLCDYFGAGEPRSLNRRVYKDTDCGASISIQLANGTWVHNGNPQWEFIRRTTPILAFTVQTIIEGSDVTVESPIFGLPVTVTTLRVWMQELEHEASRLWAEANEGSSDDE
ncbi:MAG TPA: hypothetical protein VFP27_16435 [Mycobacterium sp.]|nr:hypothetical protein [Mycobacterium sp.]